MERNVVFSHELIESHLFRVLPPFGPVLSVIGSDGNVTNRGIEPDIEHFIFILFQWDWNTPLEISGDTSVLETLLDPTVGDLL